VVASSNNGAVENVTTEIPGAKGIGEEFRTAAAAVDYFTETARTVHGAEAWAMVAARLGNRKNRGQFVDRFWFKSMIQVLKDPEPPEWRAAVDTFQAALARVRELAAERAVAARSLSLLPSAWEYGSSWISAPGCRLPGAFTRSRSGRLPNPASCTSTTTVSSRVVCIPCVATPRGLSCLRLSSSPVVLHTNTW
jgi:hypothetical protein